MLSSVVNRKKLHVGAKQIFYSMLPFKNCKCSRKRIVKETRDQDERYLNLFKKARHALIDRDLDIYRLTDTARRMRTLGRVFLNRRQLVLMRFQKHEVMESETTGESSESDKAYGKLESSNHWL